MTSRERILKTLKGEKVDKVPFCPMLSYWWENQEDEITNRGELEFLESIGADPLFRGHYPIYGKVAEDMLLCKRHIEDCTISTEVNGNRRVLTYHTSKGDLKFGYRYVEQGKTWFLVDHPVKSEEDFGILKYIMDSTHLEADYERFEREAEKLGERGLLMPLICPETKTSFQALLESWVGTEELVYALADYPEIVQETLQSMYRVSKEAAEIAANSTCEFFISWEDTSTTNISPQYYRDYILPEINMWCEILHKKGKRYVQHACGKLNSLLPDIAGSKIDVLESVTPAPTGDIIMDDVNKILPERIAVIGGIEPVELLSTSVEETVNKAQELLNIMENRGYILSNSDSCPPGVSVEKFEALAQLVSKK